MKLRDKLYLRFGLFNQRYGRMVCAFIEGLVIGLVLLFCILVIVGFFRLAGYLYSTYTTASQKVVSAEQKARTAEEMLVDCLAGRVIGRAGDETIACEGAVTFKLARINGVDRDEDSGSRED